MSGFRRPLEEQLKGFEEAVKADAGLQEKLKAAGDADAVIAIARAAGFMISAEELRRAQAEISEEELGVVAGGGQINSQQVLQRIYPKNEKFFKN